MPDEILARFIRGTQWDSKLIEWQTRAWCSHCEAVMPQWNGTLGAMLKGGVKQRLFSDREYKGVKRWENWHIPCTPDQKTAFYSFMQGQIGKPYDWRGIASFALGERDWRNADAWFCSEILIRAFEVAGLTKVPEQIPTDRLSPRDAYLIVTMLPGAWK